MNEIIRFEIKLENEKSPKVGLSDATLKDVAKMLGLSLEEGQTIEKITLTKEAIASSKRK